MNDDHQRTGHEHRATEHGTENEATRFWEAHYQKRDQPRSGNPNAFLVEAIARRQSGTALEIGCGDGGDAIWLAEQGWRVKAADISEVALRRAVERANAAGVGDRVAFKRHNLAHTFPDGRSDLVGAFYLHSPPRLNVAKVQHPTLLSGCVARSRAAAPSDPLAPIHPLVVCCL